MQAWLRDIEPQKPYINDPTQRDGNFIILPLGPLQLNIEKEEATLLIHQLQMCVSDMPDDSEFDEDGELRTLPADPDVDTVLAAEAVTDA